LAYPEQYANPNIPYSFDAARANALLDEAGWKDSNKNGIRDKGGKEMRMIFQTPINPVRQETQSLIKANLKAVGIEVEISRVMEEDFFSGDPTQTRSLNHFYADMQEYNTGSDTPDPAIYMSWWLCNEIASMKNQWQNPNNGRYCNPEYDKVWQQANQTLDTDKRAQLFQRLNSLLMQDAVVIPLVRRAVTNGLSDRITSVDPTPWDTSTWDIGSWKPVDAPTVEAPPGNTPTAAPAAAPPEQPSPESIQVPTNPTQTPAAPAPASVPSTSAEPSTEPAAKSSAE
jgi:peptide/nickel transport system substrate-binding protein